MSLAIIAMGLITMSTGSGWPDHVLGAIILGLAIRAAHEVWEIAEEERLAATALAGEEIDEGTGAPRAADTMRAMTTPDLPRAEREPQAAGPGTVTTVDGAERIDAKELSRRARAWMLYDVGNSAFQAICVTFVFATYLASDLFLDPAVAALGEANPQDPAYLAAQASSTSLIAMFDTVAAVLVALIAPALGARSDGSGRRTLWLGVFSGIIIAAMVGMFWITPDPKLLFWGALLLTIGVVFSEFAGVNYNAMLSQVSTPRNVGRVSGMGWGLGYLGSIVLLLLLLVLFIQGFGKEGVAGLLGVPSGAAGEALNIRVSVLASALWFAVFLVPILRRVPELPRDRARATRSFFATYGDLARTIAKLARTAPKVLLFLVASAVYRDGLNAVFKFGAILAAQVYGFSSSEVIYFAVAANLVAGLGTLAAGVVDDRFGPKRVIVGSLVGLVAVAAVIYLLGEDKLVFWVFGLALCLFVGPVQSSSRSYLSRIAPANREGELFGLYTTTGRAANFRASALVAIFLAISSDPKLSIVAIGIVILAGLLLVLPIEARPTHAQLGGARGGQAPASAA